MEILEQASCSSCSLSPEHDQLGKHETPHSLDTNPQILGCLTVPCGKGSIIRELLSDIVYVTGLPSESTGGLIEEELS